MYMKCINIFEIVSLFSMNADPSERAIKSKFLSLEGAEKPTGLLNSFAGKKLHSYSFH